MFWGLSIVHFLKIVNVLICVFALGGYLCCFYLLPVTNLATNWPSQFVCTMSSFSQSQHLRVQLPGHLLCVRSSAGTARLFSHVTTWFCASRV